ncbi:MAG: hypothetical protein M3018_03300 [Actinomycetota bacterium]|nr:hypothetical protein [Actinomycetota bacterium]
MEDRRKKRIAKNEASFREINERLSQGLRQVPHNPELLEFICECGHRTCEQHVQLSQREYEQVRLDSRRFAVVPGHVIPDTERVVSSSDRFDVVEKLGAAIDLADAADSRTPGTTGRRDDRL